MTPTNLPDLYSRVVAKRPELAVMSIGAPGVRMYYDAEYLGWYWDDPAPKHIGDRFAAALILAKWVEALPCGVCLVHGFGTGSAVQWWLRLDEGTCCTPVSRTPLEALAAYWLEASL